MRRRLTRLPKVLPAPRQKRLVFPWKKVLLGLVGGGALGGICYFFFFSPVFKIREVEVGTTQMVPAERIEQITLKNAEGKNIFLWRKEKVTSQIKREFPWVLEVFVYKGLPHTLKVILQEASPALNWYSQGRYYLVEEKGRVLKEAKKEGLIVVEDEKNLPVKIGQKLVPASFVEFLQGFCEEGKKRGFSVEKFLIGESFFTVKAVLKNGLQLIITPTRAPEEMWEQFIRAKEKIPPSEYVDLRFPQRVFVK